MHLNKPQHSVFNLRRRFFGGIVLMAFDLDDEFLDCGKLRVFESLTRP
jgi:hypothetical protein